ncbi:MAG: hypothetical protein JRJ85_02575, partial [Deltaproteobacteria bacterium]|nr:hypothetical protein [Deltaproteobacteria bacterium]
MTKLKDLTGKRYGRLRVVKLTNRLPGFKPIYWQCICDCGNTKNVRADYLRNGGTSSCGCFQIENRKKKGRWKIKITICNICGKQFEYNSSIKPKCCSKKCRRIFEADYVRIRSNNSLEHRIERLVASSRCRAKKWGIPYDITTKAVVQLMHNNNNTCCQTGIPFELSEQNGTGAKSPWSPSIDQIDPGAG